MNFDPLQWYFIIGAIIGTFSVFIMQKEFTLGTGVIGMLSRAALAFIGWPAWMVIARTRLTEVRELINLPVVRTAIDKALLVKSAQEPDVYEIDDEHDQYAASSETFLIALKQEIEILDAQAFKEIVTHKMNIKFDEGIQSWIVSSGKYTRSAPELSMAVELLSLAVSDAK